MRYLLAIIVAVLFILSGSLGAQPPDTLWTQTFGGSEYDDGWNVRQTLDGGFVFVGHTHSSGAGSYDAYLVKTDPSGNEEWSRTFGGTGYDEGLSVQQTQDGGFIFAGGTDSFGAGSYDVYLVKTDASGHEEWSRTFGGATGDFGYCVELTEDGGYIITGYTTSFSTGVADVYLIKTDAEGLEEWSQSFGSEEDERGYSVQQTLDGGYIVSGWVLYYVAGYYNIYLVKTDEFGNEEWSRTFGGSGDEKGYSVRQTPDGGYVIGGNTTSYGAGEADFYLVRTDSLGYELWSQTYGGSSYEYSHGLDLTQDGGYVLGGYSASFGAGDTDHYIVKIDEAGNEEWSLTVGGSSWDEGYGVRQADDGSYIVVGRTYSYGAGGYDAYLIRLVGPAVAITLAPYNPPIVIPSSGGNFNYNIEVSNAQPSTVTCDVWCDVTLPNGSAYGPVLGPVNIELPGNATIDRERPQSVPANAPAGEYSYNAYVGVYPDTVWDSDAFSFEKSLDGVGFVMAGWLNGGESFDALMSAESTVMQPGIVSVGVSPNPFNATTSLHFTLSEASHANLTVYSLNGRKIAQLVNGWQAAGDHKAMFDAAGLTSGVYLVLLEAGEESAARKVVLIR